MKRIAILAAIALFGTAALEIGIDAWRAWK